jgi:hypothetical protein
MCIFFGFYAGGIITIIMEWSWVLKNAVPENPGTALGYPTMQFSTALACR